MSNSNEKNEFAVKPIVTEFAVTSGKKSPKSFQSGAEFDPNNIGKSDVKPSKGLPFHNGCQ